MATKTQKKEKTMEMLDFRGNSKTIIRMGSSHQVVIEKIPVWNKDKRGDLINSFISHTFQILDSEGKVKAQEKHIIGKKNHNMWEGIVLKEKAVKEAKDTVIQL